MKFIEIKDSFTKTVAALDFSSIRVLGRSLWL